MSRSWTASIHGIPKKGRKPQPEDCQRRFSTRDLVELAHEDETESRTTKFHPFLPATEAL